ncbi:MAG: GMC family oxidoreductase N-terminal domain-containing protein [Paracoccus sp. (in: a-proteobacteria)]|uniref:GMC family oxidoreductase n=1 Tax=Paracoccus sp. TaxID=267 RepID=UPI0039E2EB50
MASQVFDTAKTYDLIIAGAGAAGCALAGRLSEQAGRSVLLIEAGQDAARPGAEDAEIRDPFPMSMTNPAFRWSNVKARLFADTDHQSARPHATGRSVGGGSNVNGMAADRGLPEDYDIWEKMGAQGWGWNDVLPWFKKMETALDFTGPNAAPMRGNSGPMPVRRLPRGKWGAYAETFADAAERRGYGEIDDYMSDFREGFAGIPTNSLREGRVSAAMAYLTAEVRARPNLTIQSDALVERVIIEDGQARGVSLRIGGKPCIARAREVVVSCGAIHSPSLLMRSGVGPAVGLRDHGIQVVRDLPGVGANLQNHPYLLFAVWLARNARQQPDNPWMMQNWLRYSSNHPGCGDRDMHLMPFNRTAWHALGERVGSMAVTLNQPFSTGSVTLAGADAALPPKISFNMLSDERDFERLVSGMRLSLELLNDPGMRGARRQLFLPNLALVARLSRPTRQNALRARAISAALDIAPLRALLLRKAAFSADRLLSDDAALREFVRQNAIIQLHDCGTCRMGQADDPEAVVDPQGRVHGIAGLRVVDASIFPILPRGLVHFITIMAAEKIAAGMQTEPARSAA